MVKNDMFPTRGRIFVFPSINLVVEVRLEDIFPIRGRKHLCGIAMLEDC